MDASHADADGGPDLPIVLGVGTCRLTCVLKGLNSISVKHGQQSVLYQPHPHAKPVHDTLNSRSASPIFAMGLYDYAL
jgi:hypothetical protein